MSEFVNFHKNSLDNAKNTTEISASFGVGEKKESFKWWFNPYTIFNAKGNQTISPNTAGG